MAQQGKPFELLRRTLKYHDIDYAYLMRRLGIGSSSTVVAKMKGASPWNIDEMWEIMRLIGEPPERLHEFFPKDGKAA